MTRHLQPSWWCKPVGAFLDHWLFRACDATCDVMHNTILMTARYSLIGLVVADSLVPTWCHGIFHHHDPWISGVQHYNGVIMGVMASQITSLTIVYSTDFSGTDQRKHQSSASLAILRGIHRRPVNSPHKWPVTRKMFPFDDVTWPAAYLAAGHLHISCERTRS